jgi:hypothetical protein
MLRDMPNPMNRQAVEAAVVDLLQDDKERDLAA